MKIIPVIIAGGAGARLWPLSRKQYPKQFLNFAMSDDSLLQLTVKRLKGLKVEDPLIICNEEHRFLAAEQMRKIGYETPDILLEPFGRNTAPAIALAALKSMRNNPDSILVVLAADHFIASIEDFHHSIQSALPLAVDGKLVTCGVVPTHAETGYGYIEKGAPLENGVGFSVKRFIEKPDFENARAYFESKSFLWNSGMFVFRADRYLEELENFAPLIFDACRAAMESASEDLTFLRIGRSAFEACPSDSIDYALMEKTTKAAVVPLDAGWSDVGSWSALWDVSKKDAVGNVLQGDVLAFNCTSNYIHASSRLVTAVGIQDLVVVETKDAVMVAHKNQVQEVKKIVDQLKKEERTEHHSHREVYRPWGVYDTVDNGARYQVKRITVNPGAKLSVQMHHHRAEHWIVVSGTAKITNGDKTYLLTENQSTYIPIGKIHAMENPGKIPLELIEVQSGTYLGEDDIVRFSDIYGR